MAHGTFAHETPLGDRQCPQPGPSSFFTKTSANQSKLAKPPSAPGATITHQQHAWSTRRISASYDSDGPLTSHPTTACSSITASHSTSANLAGMVGSAPARKVRLPLVSRTSNDLPLPFSFLQPTSDETYNHKITSRPSLISIDAETSNFTPFVDQGDENAPPPRAGSLATTHRDSLDLPTTRLLPKTSTSEEHHDAPTPRLKKGRSGIPRARTFNVLSNITSSLSRASLGSFGRNESRHTSASSVATFDSYSAPLGPASGGMASGLSLTIPETGQFAARDEVQPDPRQIHIAQSSEYWTGRFVALNDKFRSEVLVPERPEPQAHSEAGESLVSNDPTPGLKTPKTVLAHENPPALVSSGLARSSHRYSGSLASATSSTKSLLPKSQTTGSHFGKGLASSQTAPKIHLAQQSKDVSLGKVDKTAWYGTISSPLALQDEDDDRCRRVFLHLESLCTTPEARKSLHAWQQAYARRMGKEFLLPRGGSMEDKGWMGRLLSSTSVGKGVGGVGTSGRRKRGSLAF